jgi:hypothetical protein
MVRDELASYIPCTSEITIKPRKGCVGYLSTDMQSKRVTPAGNGANTMAG